MSTYNWGSWTNTSISSSTIDNGNSSTTGEISNSSKNACEVSVTIAYGDTATEGVEVYILSSTGDDTFENVTEDQFEYRMNATVSDTESKTFTIDISISALKFHLINNSGASVTATVAYRQSSDSISGGNTVTITLKDTNASGIPIPDATVTIRNSDNTVALDEEVTDSNGQVNFYLDDGTYKVYPRKQSSYTFTEPETLTVTTDMTEEYYGTSFSPDEPESPSLCTIYGWLYDVSGSSLSGASVEAKAKAGQFTSLDQGVEDGSASTTTDSDGYFSLSLIKSVQYRLEISTQGYSKNITVPTSSTYNYANF